MRRIGKSKEPTLKALQNITENLREKFNRSFDITIECWAYHPTNSNDISFRLSILPGVDGTSCSGNNFESWSGLLSFYFSLIKEGLPSE